MSYFLSYFLFRLCSLCNLGCTNRHISCLYYLGFLDSVLLGILIFYFFLCILYSFKATNYFFDSGYFFYKCSRFPLSLLFGNRKISVLCGSTFNSSSCFRIFSFDFSMSLSASKIIFKVLFS